MLRINVLAYIASSIESSACDGGDSAACLDERGKVVIGKMLQTLDIDPVVCWMSRFQSKATKSLETWWR